MTDEFADRLDRLESLVDRQQDRLESQAAIIERQREALGAVVEARESANSGRAAGTDRPIGRRTTLKAGGALALLGLGATTASADTQGQVGTEADPLQALYTDAVHAGGAGEVTLGDTLDLDGNAVTNAATIDATTDASSDGTSGVHGSATSATGETYGVEGVTNSSNSNAAGVRAAASSGARGLTASASGNQAIRAESTGADALRAETEAANYNGIFGNNTADSGWSWGVRGDTESTDENAYGVRGQANASSGQANGVGGVTEADGDGAAGVSGEATASTGETAGVEGVTQSTDGEAAGVRGSSTGDNYGVDGRVYDDESALPTLAAFESAGVLGRTDRSDGWGLAGWSLNDIGTFARTDDAGSAALFAINSGAGVGVHSEGILEVTEHVDVGNVGLSAYLSLNQTIADDTMTTVVFDETNRDDFGGYDTSTGQYTVQEGGDYHASFTIDWQTNFDAGTHIGYELQINGDFEGAIQADTTAAVDGQRVCQCFSRTLFDLTEGDTIEVAVSQESGGPADVWGSNQESYLTLYKVG